MKKIFNILGVLLVFITTIFSQPTNYPNVPETGRERSNAEREEIRRFYRERQSIRFSQMRAINENAQPRFEVHSLNQSESLSKKARKYVFPSKELRNKYKTILNQQNGGIIKMMSPKPCVIEEENGNEKIDKIVQKCPFTYIIGKGRYFSFRRNDYVLPFLADIGITYNYIYSLGAFNQGILVNLGNVSLENISLQTDGIDFLTKYEPSKNVEETDKQLKFLEDGIKNGGFLYKQLLPISVDETYILRVIAYNIDYFYETNSRFGKLKIYPLQDDIRKDILIAFRIVKKDEDGSQVIVWRKLTEKNSPIIEIEKLK